MNALSAVNNALRFAFASLCFDRAWNLMKFGIAIAARMPMIATTIISSIRVKPFCSLFMWGSPRKWLKFSGAQGEQSPRQRRSIVHSGTYVRAETANVRGGDKTCRRGTPGLCEPNGERVRRCERVALFSRNRRFGTFARMRWL